MAHLSGKSAYGFNGQHLGWHADGVVYDSKGKIVACKPGHFGACWQVLATGHGV